MTFLELFACVIAGFILGAAVSLFASWRAWQDTMAYLERMGMFDEENPDDPRTSD